MSILIFRVILKMSKEKMDSVKTDIRVQDSIQAVKKIPGKLKEFNP
jgi:hypothetical protein